MQSIFAIAKGPVFGFPGFRELRRKLDADKPEEARFWIESSDGEQEVQIINASGRFSSKDGSHLWDLIVCPVSMLENPRDGARTITVEVDSEGRAVYV